ncbi:toxin-antitoxin system TumE family protein [Geminocystis sp. CENA526]|uniref:toxin-antitoxin system TumE family protein n=1 Tax=Geminocystis sp. CENA526 TaxID=1355871 RepID=UPI003D6DD821
MKFYRNSILFFKEYVDVQISVDKLAYSFHYQDSDNNLIFRYDNAQHKPDLGFSDHKHINHQIIASQVPDLENIMLEIIKEYLS